LRGAAWLPLAVTVLMGIFIRGSARTREPIDIERLRQVQSPGASANRLHRR
jgi:hypothetical protein